tara:strand:+ start:627 stop:1091 length:465 start_codon:yes stop_codon:yes gene_type:complete
MRRRNGYQRKSLGSLTEELKESREKKYAPGQRTSESPEQTGPVYEYDSSPPKLPKIIEKEKRKQKRPVTYSVECDKAKKCKDAPELLLSSDECRPIHMSEEEWLSKLPNEQEMLWKNEYKSSQCAPQKQNSQKSDWTTYLLAGLVIYLLIGKNK